MQHAYAWLRRFVGDVVGGELELEDEDGALDEPAGEGWEPAVAALHARRAELTCARAELAERLYLAYKHEAAALEREHAAKRAHAEARSHLARGDARTARLLADEASALLRASDEARARHHAERRAADERIAAYVRGARQMAALHEAAYGSNAHAR